MLQPDNLPLRILAAESNQQTCQHEGGQGAQPQENPLFHARRDGRITIPQRHDRQHGQQKPKAFAQAGGVGRVITRIDHDDPDEQQRGGARNHAPQQRESGFAPGHALMQRQWNCDADDEQKPWKHHIYERIAFLFRGQVFGPRGDVFHPGEIVDERHCQDHQAAEGIQRDQAAGRARGRDAGEARGCAVRQSLQDGGRSGGSRRRFHAPQSEPIAGRRQAEAAGGRMLCSARRAGAPDTPSPGATPGSHARAYSQDRAAFIPFPAAPGL